MMPHVVMYRHFSGPDISSALTSAFSILIWLTLVITGEQRSSMVTATVPPSFCHRDSPDHYKIQRAFLTALK